MLLTLSSACSFEELPLEEAGTFQGGELEHASAHMEATQDAAEIADFKLQLAWSLGEVRPSATHRAITGTGHYARGSDGGGCDGLEFCDELCWWDLVLRWALVMAFDAVVMCGVL